MGLENAQGCIGDRMGSNRVPRSFCCALSASRFGSFLPFSITQAAEPVSRKGCFGIKWWGLSPLREKVDDDDGGDGDYGVVMNGGGGGDGDGNRDGGGGGGGNCYSAIF